MGAAQKYEEFHDWSVVLSHVANQGCQIMLQLCTLYAGADHTFGNLPAEAQSQQLEPKGLALECEQWVGLTWPRTKLSKRRWNFRIWYGMRRTWTRTCTIHYWWDWHLTAKY
jgi:hypothetical protein